MIYNYFTLFTLSIFRVPLEIVTRAQGPWDAAPIDMHDRA